QDLPLDHVIEALNPHRTLSHTPFTQIALTLQNTEGGHFDLPGLHVTAEGYAGAVARTDLGLSLHERFTGAGDPDGIQGSLEYDTDLFDRSTAVLFTERLTRVLTAVSGEPDTRVSRVDVLSEHERQDLLGTGVDRPGGAAVTTLPALFERQVRDTPQLPAVEAESGTRTYAELNAAANRLARVLVAHGAAPERHVAVALPRSAQWVETVLAVLKAGAVYVPLDPGHPTQRLATMLANVAPALLVTTREAAARLPRTPGTTLILLDDEDVRSQWAEAPGTDLGESDRAAALRAGHPAYVIHTSGSTGTPKGVVVTHAGIGALAAHQQADFEVSFDSRVLQLASSTFDVSVAELCLALLSGATLVVPEGAPAGAELGDRLAESRITHLLVAPTALAEVPRRELPALTAVITGAETLPRDLAEFWGRGRLLINAYGPSEATCDVTFATIGSGDAAETRTIGRPIAGAWAHVLDGDLRPAPPGVRGELYVSGLGVARGYLKDVATTASRFVADPYGAPGTRMYRTGDLAVRRPDGVLEFRGRSDAQTKVRGFRVETGEVESAVRRCAGVAGVEVMVREDRPGDQRLVAYVTCEPGTRAPDPAAWRATVAEQLPSYMVPSDFVVVREWPRTPHGKVDRRALPAPVRAGGGSGGAPRSAQGVVLCSLFAEVLGVERVGLDDNFFELGGHSLLATRLVGRMQEVLGHRVELREVFAAPTPAALAAREPGGGENALGTLLPLRTEGSSHPLFCVHPVSGYAWRFTALLGALGKDRPVYGLQAPGLDGSTPPAGSLKELVAGYVREMRTVQTVGPYHLVGLSLGGLVAQAVATRLQEEGEEVALLALLDSYPGPPSGPGTSTDPEEILRDIHDGYAGIHGLPAGAGEEPPGAGAARARVVDWLGQGADELSALDRAQREAVVDVMVNNVRITNETRPQVFSGNLLLVAAARDRQPWAVPEAWEEFVEGEVEVHELDIVHRALLQPGPAAEIGRLIAPRLSSPR
ncbi:amino acid adenylation domain-containing protein, partial [Streptomyces sp. NPDC021093]|uniref:amino acid adenylation domain-containing protein n=1 Tax=Streptomyces sp. NPDC021093 TaxID=3365112 RepID=UPI0037A56E48